MAAEERVLNGIIERFPVLEGKVKIQRRQRMLLDPLPRREFEKVFDYLTTDGGFHTFHLVIGVDDGADLGFIYVVSNDDKVILLAKQKAPKTDPRIKSVCAVFPNALWHERELVDLFGAIVEELPPGPTYPLPDGWPEGNYPLRKEWQVDYFDKETMTYNPPPPKPEPVAAEPAAQE